MGLLTQNERDRLVDLLLELPNIDSPAMRRQLLNSVPATVRQNIASSGITRSDVISLLSTVDENWARQTDGSWPVVNVIQQAIRDVKGTALADELQKLLDTARARETGRPTSSTTPLSPSTRNAAPSDAQSVQGSSSGRSTSSGGTSVTPHAANSFNSFDNISIAQQQQLQDALVSAFETEADLQMLSLFGLGKSLNTIVGPGTHSYIVFQLIRWALAQGRLGELVAAARERNPGNPLLRAFAEQFDLAPSITPPPNAKESTEVQIEKIVNLSNSFADVEEWMARMSEVVLPVCRVEYPSSNPMGTGFLIGPNTVVTNYHVIEPVLLGPYTKDQVVLRFDYKADQRGLAVREGQEYRLAADWLIDQSSEADLDYAVLRVEGAPGNGTVGGQQEAPKRGWLTPKSEAIVQGQPLFIVQHPAGMPLKIAFDVVTEVRNNRVRYRTNTLGGSSGSPGFDADWNLVLLHQGSDPHDVALYNQGIPFSLILERQAVKDALNK